MEINRRKFLEAAAGAVVLALAGCNDTKYKEFMSGDFNEADEWFKKDKDRNIALLINPEQPLFPATGPLVPTSTRFSGEYWYTADIGVAGGAQVATVGVHTDYTPTSAGRFIVTTSGRPKDNNLPFNKELIVRHNYLLDRMADALPTDVTTISGADWQTYVRPNLLPKTLGEIDTLEASLQTWETLASRGVAADGLWYGVDITSPTQLLGFTDTTASTNRDYAGRAALTQPSLVDFLGQTRDIQTDQQAWLTILQENPTDPTNTFANSFVSFPNSGGNIDCDFVFSYFVKNQQITMGVSYDTIPDSSDQGILNKVTAARATAYDPRSILVIPKGTKIDIRKAMDAEKAYHVANNP